MHIFIHMTLQHRGREHPVSKTYRISENATFFRRRKKSLESETHYIAQV
jgi:hypothetical protein